MLAMGHNYTVPPESFSLPRARNRSVITKLEGCGMTLGYRNDI